MAEAQRLAEALGFFDCEPEVIEVPRDSDLYNVQKGLTALSDSATADAVMALIEDPDAQLFLRESAEALTLLERVAKMDAELGTFHDPKNIADLMGKGRGWMSNSGDPVMIFHRFYSAIHRREVARRGQPV